MDRWTDNGLQALSSINVENIIQWQFRMTKYMFENKSEKLKKLTGQIKNKDHDDHRGYNQRPAKASELFWHDLHEHPWTFNYGDNATVTSHNNLLVPLTG